MEYIVSEDLKECTVCGKLTNKIDIFIEQRICSKECLNVRDKEYLDYLSKIDM